MNGILVMDKPAGMTSHDVVARVRRIIGEKSVGHLGTLDPIATGVLPLLLGKYTRLAQFFGDSEKAYEGKMQLGIATTTYDADGDPIAVANSIDLEIDGELYRGGPQSPVPAFIVEHLALLNKLTQLAKSFIGDIQQTPPPFSAKKVSGVPAYKLARRGVEVELKPKPVHVESFEILEVLLPDLVSFRCKVSAGTYVRSLVHELGQKLGCGAHLVELRRTASGEFGIDDAWTFVELEKWEEKSNSEPWLNIHPREILPHMPAVTAPPEAMAKIRNGNAVNLPYFPQPGAAQGPLLIKVFQNQNDLVAIAQRVAGTLFQPKIVLL